MALVGGATLLAGCNSPTLNENQVKNQLSLVAPNGIRLANSITDIKKSFESFDPSKTNIMITKITYGGVAPYEEQLIKEGSAIAKITYRTVKGQTGNFLYSSWSKTETR